MNFFCSVRSSLPHVLFQLHDRKAENELHCSTLRARIQGLWERLQIPQEEREALSEHMVLSKKRNIAAVRVCRPVVTCTQNNVTPKAPNNACDVSAAPE